MVRGVDRIVVDSLTWAAPLADFAEMARTFTNGHFPAVLSDLSWARLATWRYLTAQIFDPQSARPYLNQIERMRIEHDEGSRVMAWLFGGWLASRLEWKLVARTETHMQFAGGQVCEFASTPVIGEAPGHVAGLNLSARDGATFEVIRLPDACTLTRVRIGDMETERVAPLPHETLADWLGHELNRLTHSATYEAAVRLIAGGAA
jgi:glucose-6-phosphate dehydrogenase assembly protein OpcA